MRNISKKQNTVMIYGSLILICLGYLFALVPRFILAVNADVIANDFNLIPSALGILASAYFTTYAIAQTPSGIIADKVAPEILIITSLIGIALANFMFIIASNFKVAILSRLITGLAGSLVYVPALKYTAVNFPKKFALFSSMIASLNGISVMMVNGPMVKMSEAYGWRSTFVLSTIICIVSAVILFLLFLSSGRFSSKIIIKDLPTKSVKGKLGLAQAFTNKLAWPMFIRTFFVYGVLMSFQALWAGPYMMQVLKMSRGETGNIIVIMSAATLIAFPLGGYLSDNVIKKRRIFVTFGVIWVALSWLPLIFFVDTISPMLLTLILSSMMFAGCLVSGAQLTQVKEAYPPEAAGAGIGINNTFLTLGSAFLPIAFGFVIDTVKSSYAKQYSMAFVLYLICSVIAVIASFISVETHDSAK